VIAALFPGQGSQTPDMRVHAVEHAPELVELACELIGEDPFERVEQSTAFAQPAIFCASIAGWRAHGEPYALAFAGHSLGELSALVAAGALAADAGLRLVVRRGALMAAAGGGTMLALLKGSAEDAQRIAASHGVVVANDNAPGQAVLAGQEPDLRAAAATAREQGLRAMLLDVAGAFHSPAMEPALAPFSEALREVQFSAPRAPVVSCSSAQPFVDPRRELADALLRPVRWRETMLTLHALGARSFLDVGPGQVLARLVDRNLPADVPA
jgi:malonyl CoA-acyl carrier protein transacylase